MVELDEQELELKLKDFLLDINCLDELQKLGNRFNLFDVLKICRTEIRHSNVLAWLLSPNESHNLGDAFIKKLLQQFIKSLTAVDSDVMHILLLDFYSFFVYREWKHIDILMVSDDEKVVIAIENKVGSHEHDNQLQRYKETLLKEYPDYKKILIYLTPDGEEPSDDEWGVLTYEDIVNALEFIKGNTSLEADVLLMINNYIEVIRRDIMENQKLIEICSKIYNKHKKALDLIFKYRTTQASGIVKDILKEMADKGEIIFDNTKANAYISFYTRKMNSLLPNLSTPNSSWGNEHCYAYEFKMMDDKFRLACVLTGDNIPQQTADVMRKIIQIEGRHKKENLNFKWLCLHTKKYDILDESDDTEKIAATVRKAIKEMLSWEKSIIEKIG